MVKRKLCMCMRCGYKIDDIPICPICKHIRYHEKKIISTPNRVDQFYNYLQIHKSGFKWEEDEYIPNYPKT